MEDGIPGNKKRAARGSFVSNSLFAAFFHFAPPFSQRMPLPCVPGCVFFRAYEQLDALCFMDGIDLPKMGSQKEFQEADRFDSFSS